jgi:hypothetical protein
VTSSLRLGRPSAQGEPTPAPALATPRTEPGGRAVVGLALALAGVALWGAALQRSGIDLTLEAAPFYADWAPRLRWGVVIPILMALAIAVRGPQAAHRLRWWPLLAVTWLATVAWSVALAASTGWAGFTRSLRSRYDYSAALPLVRRIGLGTYVRTYESRLASAPVHVKSHPPGMVVILRWLELLGLPGPRWAAAVLVAVTATVPLGVAVTVRRLSGDAPARTVLPFLVCSPWTLLVATVADGLFTAVIVWGVALVAVAATTADERPAVAVAVAVPAGMALGGSLYLSYGMVPLVMALGSAVVISTRRYRLILPAVAGATVVTATWTIFGFQWLDGFYAARSFYRVGAAATRPYSYFVVADLVVFAVMLGPAVVAGLTTVPRSLAGASPSPSSRSAGVLGPPVRWLVGAALVAVAVADLSGLAKGEVERIWLPFVPFASLAVLRLVPSALVPSRRATGWIAGQAAVAIALQTLLVWPW